MKRNDDTFKMRLASDELVMLHEIAAERRTSAAHVVRELVRREHARTFKASPPRKEGVR